MFKLIKVAFLGAIGLAFAATAYARTETAPVERLTAGPRASTRAPPTA